LKLTAEKHKALCGLSARAELLVRYRLSQVVLWNDCCYCCG